MRIQTERSAFCVCRCCVHLYRSRRSDKELFSIGVATIAGSIGYEASEHPWSYWRTELLCLDVRPEQLDRIHKTLLQRVGELSMWSEQRLLICNQSSFKPYAAISRLFLIRP
jgi:hypothetical protein